MTGADHDRVSPLGMSGGQEEGVEITDIKAALGKVRSFIALLEGYLRMYSDPPTPSELRQIEDQIHRALPLVQRIAARADPELADNLKIDDFGFPYRTILQTSQQLAGLLDSNEEAERILGPVGPKLAAANLHPWIWNAAVNLWDDGHLREAVQAAAMALFDSHLPAKLGVPARPSAKDLVAQSFLTEPPTAGSPRLRLDDYPDPSPSWTSQHEGARFFGMGCAQLIRNLVTHGARPDEQTALEQLATLSLLAGLIDRARKVTV
jgi:hypothetical protein